MTTPGRRRAWFAAACFVILFGLGEFASWIVDAWRGDSWWAIDLRLVTDAGVRLSAGEPLYGDPRFLYPPLAAVLGRVAAWAGSDLVAIAYAVVKIILAAGGVLYFTAGWSAGWRLLAGLALTASLPFVHDVMLGNANVLLVAAMVPALFATARVRHGVLLGLAVAVFAKPLAVPVLLWLLVWRPRVLAGTIVAGLGATGVGVLTAGLPAYVQWVSALTAGTRFAAPFEGNHGVSALVPELWLPVALMTGLSLLVVLFVRGPAVGLVWAVSAGILIAPYAGTYSALPAVLALPVLVAHLPRFVLAVVALSPIATTHPLPVLAGVLLLGALALRDADAPRVLTRHGVIAWPTSRLWQVSLATSSR